MLDDQKTQWEKQGYSAVLSCLSWLGPHLVDKMGSAIFPDVAEVLAIREKAKQA